MAEQLVLKLPAREALGREAFFVAPSNAIALATLDNMDMWPSGKLVLVGPHGAGKTHLSYVWAGEWDAAIVTATDIADADIPTLAARRYVVVEDADRIHEAPNPRAAEEALFHLHNLVLAEGGRLLVTACEPPNRWALSLPDLASRMQGTSVVQIEGPDDVLLSAMLVKQFDDRQIVVPDTLIPYLVKRMERSAAALRRLVDELDVAALSAGKPISRGLAAEVLDKLE